MQRPAHIGGKELPRSRVILAVAGRAQGIVLVILMVVALLLSGMATATPFAKTPDGTAFVICAEGGSATIILDQDGNPVAPMKDCANCPDCLAPTALLTAPSRGLPLRHATFHTVQARVNTLTLPARPHLRPETRGPPPAARERLDMALTGKTADIATKDGHGMQRFRGRTQPAART